MDLSVIIMLGFRDRGGARTHMPPIAAIREAGLLRFRPIPMTTAAAD
jgi:multidrug efflux pump subunit AcrB